MASPFCRRWLSLIGVVWLQAVNGPNSDFPAYSSQVKTQLSLSQLQLNCLAFASDAGKLLGWLSGIAAARLPPRLVLLAGATLGLLGYGLQYLLLVNKIASPPYWLVFLLTVVAGNSICWINTVCYSVTINNFPSNHRIASGLSTSYVGLSAKLYTALVNACFCGPPSKTAQAFLLLNAVAPMAVSLLSSAVVRELRTTHGGASGFAAMFAITVTTGVYAMVGSLDTVSGFFSAKTHAIGLGLFLLAPVSIPLAAAVTQCLRGDSLSGRKVYDFTVEELSINGGSGGGGEVAGRDTLEKMRVREEIGAKTMLRRLDFWLYFFVYMFGVTLGLVFLNNLGQIAESHGVSTASSLVSLSSSFGFFGRLVPSLLDYFFSKRRHMISRPASITILMAPMAATFFLPLTPTSLSLYTATAVIGVCTGAITSVAISITSELFGAKSFGVNHNILVANIPIGSFLFGYLAAYLYQREAAADGRCIGPRCYRTSFFIWGSVCSLGTLLSFILYLRTREFYSKQFCREQKSTELQSQDTDSHTGHSQV